MAPVSAVNRKEGGGAENNKIGRKSSDYGSFEHGRPGGSGAASLHYHGDVVPGHLKQRYEGERCMIHEGSNICANDERIEL
jgi:hypothetical protein